AHLDPLDLLVRAGIDSGHRAVVRVADPDRAVALGHAPGPGPDRDVALPEVGGGVDAGDGVGGVGGDPHPAFGHEDVAGAGGDRDRVADDLVAGGVDAHHGRVGVVGDPHAVVV